MGSHSAVCERLIEQPLLGAVKNQYFQDPLCYVSSIKQTDGLLEKIDQILTDSGKTYSVVYLAQIRHFFEHYKDLEKGKWAKVSGWTGPEEACKVIMKGVEAYNNAK